jgi:hypothetical protein
MERLAAVCPHVDKGERAIAWALRDEPVGPTDSGWRLLCAPSEMRDVGAAGAWTIARVLRQEPSLSPHIDSPAGTTLQKEPGAAGWWRKWR